jgi:eukaryotic-like serine/threonine-protein kinase
LNPRDTGRLTDTNTRLSVSKLPFAIADKAAERLCWVALCCALMSIVMYFLQGALQPEVAEAQKRLLLKVCIVSIIAMSLGLVAARYFGWLSAGAILWLGLVYEILGGLILSAFEYSLPWSPSGAVRGVSWLALWITMCGLLIPNRPYIVLAASLVSAAMGPLAYVLVYPYGSVPINRLAIWNVPIFIVAVVTVALNRRLYRLEVDVHRANEMGAYELSNLLGKGGMGEVWRARHRMLARDAAVKLIRPEVLMRTAGREANVIRRRFEQEARSTAALRSPHTVALYDFGVADEGDFYYVMELLDGIDLETLVRKFGPQPPARVAHILRQTCHSLAEAHQRGMVHRDIKPTNLFVCRMGIDYDFTKVLDFGLVKAQASDGESRMTMTGSTTGTPAYMPPEVAMGSEEIDGRADLYGLGCVAYWLLTGRLVFEEKGTTAMILAHVQKAPSPPSLVSEIPIPASLERMVMSCLAKRPEDRPPNAETLARVLCEECEVGRWSREDAERWWRTNLPDGGAGVSAERLDATATASTGLTATL